MKAERTYIPPVFHIVQANDEQKKVMQTVFTTLERSNIDFCIVKNDEARENELVIDSFGNLDLNERKDILAEVVEIYRKGKNIRRITMR